MAGSLEDIPVSRIMLDCGSAINIIPLKMLLKLGYTINDLSPTNVMIEGWTQSGQQALGTTRLRLMIEDMMTYVTFHVIDAITSTNVLLGRPWLHEHKVVPSIRHPCFKYKTPEGETKRIFANTNISRRQKHSMQILNSIWSRSCESLLLHLQIKWLSRKNEIRILKSQANHEEDVSLHP